MFLPSFDCGKKSLIPRSLRPSRLSTNNSEFRSVLLIKLDFSSLLGPDERLALRGGPTSRIRDSQKREDRSKNNGGGSRALGFPDGVLARFGLVVSDSRHN